MPTNDTFCDWTGHHNAIDNFPLWATQDQSSTSTVFISNSYVVFIRIPGHSLVVNETNTSLELPGS